MSILQRLIARSKQSGESGIGVLLDGVCYTLGHVTTGLKMNDYFIRKEMQHSRMGWTKYTSDRMGETMRHLNSPDVAGIFADKARFDARFEKYLGREWICPAECTARQLGEFLQRHEEAIAKPRTGKGGTGVEKLVPPSGEKELAALYERLVSEDKIVEERIRQHPAVAEFYPNAINTIRVTTFYTEDGPVLLAPVMRIGRGTSVADNFDTGGMAVMLDVDTGRMLSGAMDRQYVWYERHPESGKKYEGFVVPNWDKVRSTCIAAASEEPGAAYIGWDVGITPEGCVLVEGNSRPAIVWQRIDHRGWRKEFTRAYKSALRRKKRTERA